MAVTIEQIRARFEKLAKDAQPTVTTGGKSITVNLAGDRTVTVSQSGSASLTRRSFTRYR